MPRADRAPTLREIGADLLPALPALFAPVLMISGMLLGLFTPTEAAAVTVVYVLLISGLFYRELTLAHLWNAMVMTVRSTSAILIIVAVASLFGWILAVEQIPQDFARWILQFADSPMALLIIANLIFFIAGMFLDSHHRDAAGRAGHRAAAGAGRRRSGASWDHRDLQPDAGPADAADGPVAVPGLRHRQDLAARSCCARCCPSTCRC